MRAIGRLSPEQRLAGVPALALVVCLFLPWYRTSYPRGTPPVVVHDDSSAFGVFTLVEASVLLVAGAVLYLLWARAQRRGFHLPGGDGWAVTIAGGWVLGLLVWRLFDKPGVAQGSVGVQWGIFVTMVVAGLLIAAGQRLRAAHVAEPPNPAETGEHPIRPRREARVASYARTTAEDQTVPIPEYDHRTRRLPPDRPYEEDVTRALPPEPFRRDPGDEDRTRLMGPDEDRDDERTTRRFPPPPPPPSPPPPPPPGPPDRRTGS